MCRVHFEAERSKDAGDDEDGGYSDDVSEKDSIEKAELHPLLQWDLEMVAWFVRKKEEHPWLKTLVHATTSRYRTQDLSLLLWLAFLVMVPEFGFPYVWICVVNLLRVLLLQYLANVLRPIDLDCSLYERAHTDPDTSGFPCVDTHMAVVVLLPVVLHLESLVVQTGLMLVMLHIGLAKLFVATRFVSQVVGSYLTGVAGILIGNHGRAVVKAYKLSRGYKYVSLAIFLDFVDQTLTFFASLPSLNANQYGSYRSIDRLPDVRTWGVDREQRQSSAWGPKAGLSGRARQHSQLGRADALAILSCGKEPSHDRRSSPVSKFPAIPAKL